MDKTYPNLGRQPEIDVVKGLSILCMIACHVYEDLTPNAEGVLIDFIYGFTNYACGASAFMFCMGIGISYSSHQKVRDLLYRGFILFTMGLALNLCRFVAPVFLNALVTGTTDFLKIASIIIIGSDIMTFAGLAFALFGILKYFKLLSPTVIISIAIVLNILGSIFAGFETENYFITQLVGHFIGSKAESLFPLSSWFIFVAFGIVYGDMYREITSKKQYYVLILLPCIIISVIILYIQKFCSQDILQLFNSPLNLYWMKLPDAISCIIYSITLIGLAWTITQKNRIGLLSFVSRNINKFYCISWIFIGSIGFSGNYFYDKGVYITIILSILIFTMTYFIIMIYNKYLITYCTEVCSRYKIFIITIIYLLTGIISYYLLTNYTEFPNMHNGYLMNLKV